MTEFEFTPLLPTSGDATPYRLLTTEGVSTFEANGHRFLQVEPEVLTALRAVVPEDPDKDPGRDYWIEYARELVRDLRRIKEDPVLTGTGRSGKKSR